MLMRKTYRCTNVKFCMEDEVQRRAWEYLHNGECKDGSYGKILSEALVTMLDKEKSSFLQLEHIENNVSQKTARLVLEGMRELLKETVPTNGTAMLMDETMQKQEDDIAEDMLDFALAMGE